MHFMTVAMFHFSCIYLVKWAIIRVPETPAACQECLLYMFYVGSNDRHRQIIVTPDPE